jgi:hypothetical protein
VLGFVNPGAGMKHMNTTSKEVQQLTKKDVVVLWGGSNDIARNNATEGMNHTLDFITKAYHTNLVLISAPHRHDLIWNLCVNNEVETFNKKLRKRLDRFDKVNLIDIVSDRNLYTKHRQHLNSEGKENMAKKIASSIVNVLTVKTEPICSKGPPGEGSLIPDPQTAQGAVDLKQDEGSNETRRTSTRNKKKPKIKGNDFLWGLGYTVRTTVENQIE